MPTLSLKRLRFCREADNLLKVLKARTGVTSNVICRIGYTLSLDEPGALNPNAYPEDSDREINRYTLLGEYDATYVALLKQRMAGDDALADSDLNAQFRAHMNRGVVLLAARVKSLADLLVAMTKRRG